jgi:hypothetical protein
LIIYLSKDDQQSITKPHIMGSCQSIPVGASRRAKIDTSHHTHDSSLASIHPDGEVVTTTTAKKPIIHQSDTKTSTTTTTTSHPILLQIERLQRSAATCCGQGEAAPVFGRILDAGTGLGSLDWIRHLVANHEEFGVTGWTAVTASEAMAKNMKQYAEKHNMNHINNKNNQQQQAETSASASGIVLGNWFNGYPIHDNCNPADSFSSSSDLLLLKGELYDTILVDYLIGAIDGYTPYLQDCIFDRLQMHLNPGGRMYIVGLEPIPEQAPGTADILCQTRKLRDACILLAGNRCYRGRYCKCLCVCVSVVFEMCNWIVLYY